MLVDADNLDAGRLRVVAAELARAGPVVAARTVVAGHPAKLARVDWPAGADVRDATGWQSADAALAAAYVVDDEPLVLVTGDGDFALLAARHPGRVLVVGGSAATSSRLREHATVVDPAHDGVALLRSWLAPPQP